MRVHKANVPLSKQNNYFLKNIYKVKKKYIKNLIFFQNKNCQKFNISYFMKMGLFYLFCKEGIYTFHSKFQENLCCHSLQIMGGMRKIKIFRNLTLNFELTHNIIKKTQTDLYTISFRKLIFKNVFLNVSSE